MFLKERRDELEGLDLAIERQKKSLKDLKREEKNLMSERQSAKEELELISRENARHRRYVIFIDYINSSVHHSHFGGLVKHAWLPCRDTPKTSKFVVLAFLPST